MRRLESQCNRQLDATGKYSIVKCSRMSTAAPANLAASIRALDGSPASVRHVCDVLMTLAALGDNGGNGDIARQTMHHGAAAVDAIRWLRKLGCDDGMSWPHALNVLRVVDAVLSFSAATDAERTALAALLYGLRLHLPAIVNFAARTARTAGGGDDAVLRLVSSWEGRSRAHPASAVGLDVATLRMLEVAVQSSTPVPSPPSPPPPLLPVGSAPQSQSLTQSSRLSAPALQLRPPVPPSLPPPSSLGAVQPLPAAAATAAAIAAASSVAASIAKRASDSHELMLQHQQQYQGAQQSSASPYFNDGATSDVGGVSSMLQWPPADPGRGGAGDWGPSAEEPQLQLQQWPPQVAVVHGQSARHAGGAGGGGSGRWGPSPSAVGAGSGANTATGPYAIAATATSSGGPVPASSHAADLAARYPVAAGVASALHSSMQTTAARAGSGTTTNAAVALATAHAAAAAASSAATKSGGPDLLRLPVGTLITLVRAVQNRQQVMHLPPLLPYTPIPASALTVGALASLNGTAAGGRAAPVEPGRLQARLAQFQRRIAELRAMHTEGLQHQQKVGAAGDSSHAGERGSRSDTWGRGRSRSRSRSPTSNATTVPPGGFLDYKYGPGYIERFKNAPYPRDWRAAIELRLAASAGGSGSGQAGKDASNYVGLGFN